MSLTSESLPFVQLHRKVKHCAPAKERRGELGPNVTEMARHRQPGAWPFQFAGEMANNPREIAGHVPHFRSVARHE